MKKKIYQGVKVGLVIGAWSIAFAVGLILFIVTTTLGQMIIGGPDPLSFNKGMVLNSVIGVIALLILILALWPKRKTSYLAKRLILPLWIGVGIYLLICIFNLVSISNSYISDSQVDTCKANPQELLTRMQSSIYPIATDLGYGTAIAVSADGYLLTADHVVEGFHEIYINAVDKKTPLQVVSRAPEYDLALLKATFSEDITYAPLTSNYAIGDSVYAIGYPGNVLGAGQASVSSGILSRSLDTDQLELNGDVINVVGGLELIQTDAAINPGNSGGALFNRCGVIGVVSFISNLGGYEVVSEQGISYAISAKSAALRFDLSIAQP